MDKFDSSKGDWPQYIERVDHFFTANGIDYAGKKKSAFLSSVGSATYATVRNLVSPAKPGDKSYDQLVTILTDHFNPTPSETVQRFKFHSRFRKPSESVAEFVSELRSLAEFCNFGANLEEMLRDRLVCGIQNTHIQKRLLGEKTLTFARALELSQVLETASKNAKELTEVRVPEVSSNTVPVHAVKSSTRRKQSRALQKDYNEKKQILRNRQEVRVSRVARQVTCVVNAIFVIQSVTNAVKLDIFKMPVRVDLVGSMVIRLTRKPTSPFTA